MNSLTNRVIGRVSTVRDEAELRTIFRAYPSITEKDIGATDRPTIPDSILNDMEQKIRSQYAEPVASTSRTTHPYDVPIPPIRRQRKNYSNLTSDDEFRSDLELNNSGGYKPFSMPRKRYQTQNEK